MPKGGVLHVHAIGSAAQLVAAAVSAPFAPVCFYNSQRSNNASYGVFLFSTTVPKNSPKTTWTRCPTNDSVWAQQMASVATFTAAPPLR